MQEANRLVDFYKSKGVLAFISNKGVSNLYPEQGEFKVGIWIVADNQFSDTVALLTDPDHEVEHPLSQEQMAALNKQLTTSYAEAVRMGVRVDIYVVLGVTGLALLAYLLTVYF